MSLFDKVGRLGGDCGLDVPFRGGEEVPAASLPASLCATDDAAGGEALSSYDWSEETDGVVEVVAC